LKSARDCSQDPFVREPAEAIVTAQEGEVAAMLSRLEAREW